MRGYYPTRVAPFGYLRIIACLTAPHSFSQLTTPFVASPRLGIHHTPFVACPSSLSHVELPRAYTRFSFLISYYIVKELFPQLHFSLWKNVMWEKERIITFIKQASFRARGEGRSVIEVYLERR